MAFAWFIYTIVLMVVCVAACSTAVVVWVLAGRRDALTAALGFLFYTFDVGAILFDEYIRVKPLGDIYLDSGLTHPVFQILLNAALLCSLWMWVGHRLGTPASLHQGAACFLCLLVASALLAPVGERADFTRTLLYWCFRDVVVILAFARVLWRSVSSSSEAERSDLARTRVHFGVALGLSLLVLIEDVANIAFIHPDYSVEWVSDLIWHMTERNLSENVLVMFLAILMVRVARQTMMVFARHPTHDEDRLLDERLKPDFDVRLLAFCDERGMSNREREVLSLVLRGKDIQNIASELTISTGTVKAHLHRIYKKVGVGSRKDLLDRFWRG